MNSLSDTRILYGMLRRMAVDGWLSPRELADITAPPERLAEVFRQLRAYCTVGTGSHDGLWRLTDEARRRLFSGWKRDDLVAALHAVPDNTVAASLKWAIGMLTDARPLPPAYELTDRRAALHWLPPHLHDPSRPDHDELTQQIERTAACEDVDLLMGPRFVGRAIQLHRLHELLPDDFGERQVVNIWGKGGIGKSTLLAAFRHGIAADDGTLVLRLDFDRPDLNPIVPASLDREIVRQIGREIPSLWHESRAVLAAMLDFAAASARVSQARSESKRFMYDSRVTHDGSTNFDSGWAESDMESAGSTQRSDMLHVFNLARPHVHRFVVMLDTFERVEAAGGNAVGRVLDWMVNLLYAPEIPALAVVAGRSKLEFDFPRQQVRLVDMHLGQLSRRDSLRLLTLAGCPADLSRLLATHLPVRSPLILRLAADAVNSNVSEGPALLGKLREGQIPDGLLSAYLYTRILAHISDPILRAYAHASLALTELDVGVLANVLMPEVEPDAVDTSGASDRFDALATVHWLIERSGDKLRLRTDQRELVQVLVTGDSTKRNVHQVLRANALAYHMRFTDSWHQAMALYYRIREVVQNGAAPATIAGFAEQVRRHARELAPFSADLPDSLRVVFAERSGDQVDLQSAVDSLSQVEWRRMMDGGDGRSGRGQEIVSREDPLVAHQLYVTRPTASGALPPAYALHAACDSARWDELKFDMAAACDQLMAKFSDADRWSPHLQHLGALVRFALFARPDNAPGALGDVLGQLVPRCAAYGATPIVGDTFAIAEAFHRRRYLSPKFLERMRPSPKSDRILLLRSGDVDADIRAPLTGAAVVRFGEPASVRFVVLRDSSTAASEELVDLAGKRWSAYQRFYRHLGMGVVARDAQVFPYLRLPEFYRPLRQALLEAFSDDTDVLEEFLGIAETLLPEGPAEFKAHGFRLLLRRDPHTWLHALVQYADWCGVMFEVVACAVPLSRKSHRLRRVLEVLVQWQGTLQPFVCVPHTE